MTMLLHIYTRKILEENDSLGVFDMNNLGNSIKSKVRHAIAHICRGRNRSIIVDDLKQREVLYAVKGILKNIAEYKLNNEHNMNQRARGDVYSFFDPDTEFID